MLKIVPNREILHLGKIQGQSESHHKFTFSSPVFSSSPPSQVLATGLDLKQKIIKEIAEPNKENTIGSKP
jgi:hypothetical protein